MSFSWVACAAVKESAALWATMYAAKFCEGQQVAVARGKKVSHDVHPNLEMLLMCVASAAGDGRPEETRPRRFRPHACTLRRTHHQIFRRGKKAALPAMKKISREPRMGHR